MPTFPKSPCDVTESIKSFEEALISIAPFTASKLAKDAAVPSMSKFTQRPLLKAFRKTAKANAVKMSFKKRLAPFSINTLEIQTAIKTEMTFPRNQIIQITQKH